MLRQLKPMRRSLSSCSPLVSCCHSNRATPVHRCLRLPSSNAATSLHRVTSVARARYTLRFEPVSLLNTKSESQQEEHIEQESPAATATVIPTPTPTPMSSTGITQTPLAALIARMRFLTCAKQLLARIIPFANSSAALKSQAAQSPTSSLAPTKSLTSVSLDSQNRTLRFAFIGNLTITTLKLVVFAMTNSQAMFAEFIHTGIDSINQGFLLLGAREAMKRPDHRHQMGYGRAPYFWSLVSALNIFWIGVVFNSYHTLFHSSTDMTPHWYTWLVLALSFCIDGAVLKVALTELNRNRPAGRTQWKHWKNLKNPLIIGTIMEDFAAVTGVVIAGAGIGLSSVTGNHIFDHIASLSISALLLYTSYTLIRTNYAYLLGFSLSPTLQANITHMIASRPSIQSVYSVRGEWIASDQFAFRCEIDFDGSYFSARLEENYRELFKQAIERDRLEEEKQTDNGGITSDSAISVLDLSQPPVTRPSASESISLSSASSVNEALYRFAPQFITYPTVHTSPTKPSYHLSNLLASFAEDVTRLVEEEVVSIEQEIRAAYPQAAFIELEPASDSSLRTHLGPHPHTVFNFRLVKDASKTNPSGNVALSDK